MMKVCHSTRLAVFKIDFHYQGVWKGEVPLPKITMEELEGSLQGQQQQDFLTFLRKMLRWRPEDRLSARDLLSDPWLRSP